MMNQAQYRVIADAKDDNINGSSSLPLQNRHVKGEDDDIGKHQEQQQCQSEQNYSMFFDKPIQHQDGFYPPNYKSHQSSSSLLESSMLKQRQNQLEQLQHQRQKRLSVIMFSICVILLFADQNLMAPNLTAIAKEFDFTDNERDRKLGGDISLAFYLVGAPAAIIIGCLADQMNRITLLAWTVGIGEGACILTMWITQYWQLYVCRALTGISIAGALPIIYSILGDMFVAEDRVGVCAMVSFGTGAGVALGQAIAGFLGPTFGWRVPFLIVGIPALLSALLICLTVTDPERGSAEQAMILSLKEQNEQQEQKNVCDQKNSTMANVSDNKQHYQDYPSSPINHQQDTQQRQDNKQEHCQIMITSNPIFEDTLYNSSIEDYGMSSLSSLIWSDDWTSQLRATVQLVSTKSIFLGMIQGLPGCIPWGILSAFLNDYLSENCGYTIESATIILMFFSIGNGSGLAIGAWVGRYLYQIDNRYPQLFSGSMATLGCIPFWILLNFVDASTTPYWLVCTIATIGGCFSGPTGPIIKSTLVNVTMPQSRGQTFAMCILFDDFGKGLGPFFVSLLIVHFNGRLPAFNVGVTGWILCGMLNALLYFTVKDDEANVQTLLRLQQNQRQQQRQRPQQQECSPVVSHRNVVNDETYGSGLSVLHHHGTIPVSTSDVQLTRLETTSSDKGVT